MSRGGFFVSRPPFGPVILQDSLCSFHLRIRERFYEVGARKISGGTRHTLRIPALIQTAAYRPFDFFFFASITGTRTYNDAFRPDFSGYGSAQTSASTRLPGGPGCRPCRLVHGLLPDYSRVPLLSLRHEPAPASAGPTSLGAVLAGLAAPTAWPRFTVSERNIATRYSSALRRKLHLAVRGGPGRGRLPSCSLSGPDPRGDSVRAAQPQSAGVGPSTVRSCHPRVVFADPDFRCALSTAPTSVRCRGHRTVSRAEASRLPLCCARIAVTSTGLPAALLVLRSAAIPFWSVGWRPRQPAFLSLFVRVPRRFVPE